MHWIAFHSCILTTRNRKEKPTFPLPIIIEKLNAVINVVILFQELHLTLMPYTVRLCGSYLWRNEGNTKKIPRNHVIEIEKSDNFGRVKKIVEYARTHFSICFKSHYLGCRGRPRRIFGPYKRKRTIWNCTSIEADARLSKHIDDNLGIESLTSDYRTLRWDRKFDIICLNKVLEHIEEPLGFLEKAKDDLKPNGFIYLELPDGEKACLDPNGFKREEFLSSITMHFR